MRLAIPMLASLIALAAQLPLPAGAADLAFSPSGHGDSGATTCRSPQPQADGSVGPRICMHNRVWAMLTNTARDLAADGRTVVLRPLVDDPDGKGPSESVTCRAPLRVSSSRLRKGGVLCLTNGTWADLIARHYVINAAGQVVDMNNRGPANGPDNFPIATGSYGPE